MPTNIAVLARSRPDSGTPVLSVVGASVTLWALAMLLVGVIGHSHQPADFLNTYEFIAAF